MNKNEDSPKAVTFSCELRKILRIMKLTTFLFLITVLQVFARVTYSQITDLQLNPGETTVESVLQEIESQSEFYFLFNQKMVDINRKIILRETDIKIHDVLTHIFNGTNVDFVVIDRQIVLSPVEYLAGIKKGLKEARQGQVSGQVRDASITGIVKDRTGNPIPGVNVIVKGTTIGTITNGDGEFSLNIPLNAETLQFSFVGMQTQEIPIDGRTTFTVVMDEDFFGIEEVVAVGYGTQKSRDIIGSVASVNSEQLSSLKSLTVTEALQGRASGVHITTNSGALGSPSRIRIRGENSISSGKSPLWVVDGIPIYSGQGLEVNTIITGRDYSVTQDPLSMINPNDIESVEVLKDAAATAIYGSRGSNGVILVTTKSGKGSGGEITVDYSTGASNLTKGPNDVGFLNTQQWLAVVDKSIQHLLGPDAFFDPVDILGRSQVPFSPLSRAQAEAINVNWFDEVLQQGNFHDFNISASPNIESGSVYLALNYRKDKGVIQNNELERISFRLNTDYSPINNIIVGNTLSVAYSDNDKTKTGHAGPLVGHGGGSTGPWEAAHDKGLPWLALYDEDEATGYWSGRAGNIKANNDPRFIMDNVKQYRAVGGLFAQYNLPVDGLSVRTEAGVDVIQNARVEWKSASITDDSKSHGLDQSVTRRSLNYNAYIAYDRTFDRHGINAVVGTESMAMNQWMRLQQGTGLVTPFKELGTNPLERINMSASLNSEDYLQSYFGRANYKFNDRYYLGLSLRRDGSSKFSSDYRWGTFTAYSAGWIISEENFFQPLSQVVNLLKLRGSYGQTGNNSIPANVSLTVYSNDPRFRYGLDSDIPAGTQITNIGARDITWETTGSYDVGLDFGLFNNRINGSFAYYYRDISDLLLQVALPASTGVANNTVWANIGDMNNQGVEFNISTVNVRTKDFRWSTDFNISTQSNKIESLTPELDKGGKGISYGSGHRAVTGKSLGTYYMPYYAGIDPDKGVEMIWEIDRALYDSTGVTKKTGRKIGATQQNISEHRYLFDNRTGLPTYFGGLNNNFTYKNFELNVFFTFSGGNYIYDDQIKRNTRVGSNPLWADVTPENIWSPTNRDAKYPLQSYGFRYPGANWDWTIVDPNTGEMGYWNDDPNVLGNYNLDTDGHSRWLYKGDYVRLKNLTLAYNVPSRLISQTGLKGLRIFGQATNLWTGTKYPGYDPEVEGVSWVQRRTKSTVPNTTTISFGASVKF